MTAPDDTRAQAAGACDAAAIGARLHAIDREGVRSIDDALVMGAAITDPSTGDVEWILRHAPDVIDCLADAVRRFTAAAADAFADRVRACHAAAARIDRYTLPAEVLALIADVPALLADLTRLRAHAAGEPARVAAAVAGERVRTLQEAAVLCREQRTMHRRMGHAQAIDRADGAAGCAEEIDALAAHERLDALLRGAPGGYVEARVVREYLAALDVLPGDLATINAAIDRERTARTALDAALATATTTPKEGHGP